MPSTVGKYFYMKNKRNNLYLDYTEQKLGLDDAEPAICTISLCKKKTSDMECQIWFQDPLTGTLRNKKTNKCLDVTAENKVVLDVFKTNSDDGEDITLGPVMNSPSVEKTESVNDDMSQQRLSTSSSASSSTGNQKWHYNKDKQTIESYSDKGKVLDVVDQARNVGSQVCVNEYGGKDSQIWRLEPTPMRYFYLTSLSEQGMALDCLGGRTSPGSKVGLYARKTKVAVDSQLWFEDFEGNIRPKSNEKLVLNVTRTGASIDSPDPRYCNQYWLICGNKIVNAFNYNFVLSAGRYNLASYADDNHDDDFVIFYSPYRGETHQHWCIIYV